MHEYFDQANRFDEHEQSHDIGTTSGELISHETLFRQWKPEATENLARTLFSPAVIDDVARGTSCRVEWRKEALAILGDDQHEVDIVLTSLKDIEISHVSSVSSSLCPSKLIFSFKQQIRDLISTSIIAKVKPVSNSVSLLRGTSSINLY